MFRYCISMMLLFCVLSASPLFAHSGEVKSKIPAPGKFCTGLTFDGSSLWAADYKADKLYMLDPATGMVKRDIPSPGFWPMGLAFDGKWLWNIDSKQKKIFCVNPENGTILRTIDAPSDNPEGLVWDGETLWVSDYKDKKIMKIDLSDGTAVRTVMAPAKSPNGLTFDGKYLWCSDRTTDEIYMINPDDGEVFIIIDAPGPFSRGLAWDGEFIWNIDFQNDEIFKLVRSDKEKFRLKDPRKANVTLTHEVKVYGKGQVNNLDVYLAVPENSPQQKILSKTFGPGACEMKKDRWNQQVAHFNYRDIPTEQMVQSIMEAEVIIHDIRYFIFPDRCGKLEDIPEDIRKLYTSNGSKFMTDDPYMKELAEKLVGDEKNPYFMARKIFDHVRKNIEYKLEGGWNAAPVVLKRKTGSCSEYTFCFISLCRAAGLPARYVGAIVVRGDDASFDDVFHRWPEVYLPNYGWVPIDPQGGDKPSPRDRAMNIGSLSNRFLITTQGGGDSKYLGWYYNYNEFYEMTPQVKLNIETFGEWAPLK